MAKSPKAVSMEDNRLGLFTSEPGSAMYEQKIQLERIKNELLKFGLSANQAKVYIFLGKHGAKTAPEVCKSLGLPRTETYGILNILQNYGVVTTKCCQPTKYEAMPLSKTIQILVNSEKERVNILLEQEKEIVELWNKIPSFVVETNDSKMEKLQMLQGAPQVYNKIKDMIASTSEEFLMFCTQKDFFRFYHADLIKSLVNSPAFERIIISPAYTMPEIIDDVNRERIRIMPTGKTDRLCFMVKDFDEAILFLRNATHPTQNIFAVWADSRAMVDTLRILFEFSWETSKLLY